MTHAYQGRLTRFLVHKSLYNANCVKAAAFAPPKDGRLSVDKTEGRAEEDIWNDRRFVCPDEPEKILARADFAAAVLSDCNLQLEDVPIGDFKYHAEVIGWDKLEVAEQLSVKNTLAFRSQLVKIP